AASFINKHIPSLPKDSDDIAQHIAYADHIAHAAAREVCAALGLNYELKIVTWPAAREHYRPHSALTTEEREIAKKVAHEILVCWNNLSS
ncbi:MAG: hypothetical protein ABH877_03605, partial [bacterium]